MSSDSTSSSRKKRSPSNTKVTAEGDHRKRRRNRTTQSCINCHTSKRMCDRKRPACARCTQLGLTGLCVYEVDDPKQRSDAQDEGSRLLQRVAELEGVIRELKNKPHPRWSQPSDARGRRSPTCDGSSEVSQCWMQNPQAETTLPSLPPATPVSVLINPPEHTSTSPTSQLSYFSSSPLSSPSPATTPTDEHTQSRLVINSNSNNHSPLPSHLDLTSMFLPYPGSTGYDGGALYADTSNDNNLHNPSVLKQNSGHCGCLLEPSNYNVVLELSLRLRKAADVLSHSPGHRLGSRCLLTQRISELDSFATSSLGDIDILPDGLAALSTSSHRSNALPWIPASASDLFGTSTCPPLPTATVSPHSLQALHSWDQRSSDSDHTTLSDDSFMTWEPPRRV